MTDIRYDTLAPFRARGIETFESVEPMFESPNIDAVWIATRKRSKPGAVH